MSLKLMKNCFADIYLYIMSGKVDYEAVKEMHDFSCLSEGTLVTIRSNHFCRVTTPAYGLHRFKHPTEVFETNFDMHLTQEVE